MKIEKIHTPETKNQLPNIPKSKEIFAGDINDAVITVQQITGYEITPDWWEKNVGNEGSTEKILERFDAAFEKFIHDQMIGAPTDTLDVEPTYTPEKILAEADKEYAAFKESFKNDPEYDKLSQEFLEALHAHLISKYSVEDIYDTERDTAFGVIIELSDEYNDEELQQLKDATKEALISVNEYLDGKLEDIFGGLKIRIGEDINGGGEAIATENLVELNGTRMLMSLAEMREKVPNYNDDELTGSKIDDNEVCGALKYTLVHEMGHILDELTETGDKMHRVSANESPTKYGREADEHSTEKDHEAFAEGFAHMVYGMPVSEALAKAVNETIGLKLAEVKKSTEFLEITK